MTAANPEKPARFSIQQLLPALSAAIVIGVIEIFVEVSFGAILFSGPYSQFLAVGIGLCLAGALIHTAFAAVTSSSRNTIAVVQDAPIAILAVIFASIATAPTASTPETMLATGLATIFLASLLAGIFFWLLGRFNLGRLVRFIPYPVIGGFLAGTGFLLLIGGIGVMVDVPLGPELLRPEFLWRWLPGLLYGVMLLLVLRRYTQFWVMPSLLVGGLVSFYGIYFLTGGTMASALADDWLLGPFPGGRLWQPVLGLALSQADWQLVLGNTVKIGTALIIGAISLLMNVSGLEVISNEDVDLNRELRWSGIANIVGALAVSPIGYMTLSFSALGYQLAGRTRAVGALTAVILGMTVVFGAAMLSNFPRMIAGGLLIFVGLSFMVEWLVDSWHKLPLLDYLLIWVILVVIATMGFLEGVGVGILIAALLFLVNYSRINVVRHAATRADYASAIERPPLYEQLLEQRGTAIAIITLQGYIFFGTAHRLVEQITERFFADSKSPPLRFLVIDFRLVTGIDTSAALSFMRLKQATDAADVQVLLTGLEPDQRARLEAELSESNTADGPTKWQFVPALDEGVAWCEEQMIAVFVEVGLAAAPKTVISAMEEYFPSELDEVDWLDYLHPGSTPEHSPQFAAFMDHLARVEFAAGDILLSQGASVDGLYFLESGRAAYETVDEAGRIIDSGAMEAGTTFDIDDFYAGRPGRRTVIGASAGVVYSLSAEALAQMEAQSPQVAIALHRVLAAQLGERAGRAEALVKTLQR